MKPHEFADLLEYVRVHNGWSNGIYEEVITSNRKAIKHVEGYYDTRDGSVYKVTFRCVTDWVNERTFLTGTSSQIDAIYKWLDEPPVTEENMRKGLFSQKG